MRMALFFAVTLGALLSLPASADDRATLDKLLDDFLASTNQKQAHQRFWAEDLVYTSSSGKRFGKDKILEGFAGGDTQPATAAYRAEEVDIRLFGDTAVVAFRLVAGEKAEKGPAGKGPAGQDTTTAPSHYFNTGTFLKRDGEWRAVAWQATSIPTED